MERIEEVATTKIDIYHHFYCDECGEYLGKEIECCDGYYHKIGKLNFVLNLPQGYYEIDKYLCDQCKERFFSTLVENLTNIGFKREGNYDF